MSADKAIYFIYDGECPLCSSAAQALRIKRDYGTLHLINARGDRDSDIVQRVNDRGLDLDDGMVIYADDHFYHGKDALKFMARYGDTKNAFTGFCKAAFWSEIIAHITYPWMRGTRNWLLHRKSVGRIDNLHLSDKPIFKSIFGATWDDLPPVMKKHYANRPYSNDVSVVEGTLDVMCKPPLLWLAPIMKLMGQIPCVNAQSVPVTVRFESDKNSKAFHFVRTFNFKEGAPYIFHSRMVQVKGDEVVEIMRFGLGWKMRYMWEDGKVKLKHKGYVLYAFGHFIPVPLTFLIGAGHAEEVPIDDDHFDMFVTITHPWFGKIYEYKGTFEVLG